HHFTHALDRLALQSEGLGEARVDVAAGATKADHRIFLVRLVTRTAEQAGVFVRLEVGQPHDHRLGVDRRGDGGDAFGQTIYVELDRTGVAGDALVDLRPGLGVLLGVFQQGLRMHADVAGDDHFQTGQADAGVRQLAEVERTLRVGHVHHDLQRRLGHVAEIRGDSLELQDALVDRAGVAFGAGHGDVGTVGYKLQRVAGADHGRHAEFARDDRCVTGTSAAVGDDRRGALHHRLPVGIGHVGDQHVAVLHLVHVAQRADHAGFAGADLLADRAAFGQHLAFLAEVEALQLGRVRTRLHRFRARLHDVDLAGVAVLRPLDVHRAAVVFFDDQRLAG